MSELEKMYEFVNRKHSFVKLAKRDSLESHKIAIERGWDEKLYSAEEADGWVRRGCGVGLDVSRVEGLVVLDIDDVGQHVEEFLNYCAEQGFIVCRAPSGGGHVFLHDDVVQGYRGKGYFTMPSGARVVMDVYGHGGNGRYVVLPIAGTPRARLGGVVMAAGGQRKEEAVSVETFLEYLYEVLNSEELRQKRLVLENKARVESGRGIIKELLAKLNKSFYQVTAEDLEYAIKTAVVGERHNTILAALTVAKVRGMAVFDSLVELARAKFERPEEAEREVEGMLKWLNGVRAEAAPSPAEQAAKEAAAAVESLQSGNKKRTTADDFKLLFAADNVTWTIHSGTEYILAGGKAYTKETLRILAAAKGVSLSDERARLLFDYIKSVADYNKNAYVATAELGGWRGRSVVAGRYQGRLGVLIANGGQFEFVQFSDLPEGLYIEHADVYRDLDAIDKVVAAVNKFVNFQRGFYGVDEVGLAKLCLALAVASPLVRGVAILLGRSGVGKSRAAAVMSAMANGRIIANTSGEPRDILALAANASVAVIDEISALKEEAVNIINTLVTMGSVSHRELHTTRDLNHLTSNVSFFISTTDLQRVRADLLRRSVVIEMGVGKLVYKDVPEADFYHVVNKHADDFLVAYMYLSRNLAISDEDNLAEFMFDPTIEGTWGGDVATGKSDIYKVYKYFTHELGVSAEVAEEVWCESRLRAAAMGLGVWEKVLDKIEDDDEFAKKMEEGMEAKDIAEDLAGPPKEGQVSEWAKEVRSLMGALTRSANKVAVLLQEQGWLLRVEQRAKKTSRRQTVKINVYAMKKGNTQSRLRKRDDVDLFTYTPKEASGDEFVIRFTPQSLKEESQVQAVDPPAELQAPLTVEADAEEVAKIRAAEESEVDKKREFPEVRTAVPRSLEGVQKKPSAIQEAWERQDWEDAIYEYMSKYIEDEWQQRLAELALAMIVYGRPKWELSAVFGFSVEFLTELENEVRRYKEERKGAGGV